VRKVLQKTTRVGYVSNAMSSVVSRIKIKYHSDYSILWDNLFKPYSDHPFLNNIFLYLDIDSVPESSLNISDLEPKLKYLMKLPFLLFISNN